jgi:hypothetical protein
LRGSALRNLGGGPKIPCPRGNAMKVVLDLSRLLREGKITNGNSIG